MFLILSFTANLLYDLIIYTTQRKKLTGRMGVWNLQCLGFSREMAAARTDSLPLNIHLSGSRLMTPAINTQKNKYCLEQFTGT